jgi:hypothetical protein
MKLKPETIERHRRRLYRPRAGRQMELDLVFPNQTTVPKPCGYCGGSHETEAESERCRRYERR